MKEFFWLTRPTLPRLTRNCCCVIANWSLTRHRPGGTTAQQSRHRLRDRARTNWSDGPRRRNMQTGRQPPGARRLRDRLARVVRTSVHHERYRPSALWEKRRQGRMLPVNPKHYEYPALLAEALDVIVARRWDVAGTAGVLGISMSQLARLLRHDKAAFDLVNEGRQSMGLPRLR